jgi:hypothetical protein
MKLWKMGLAGKIVILGVVVLLIGLLSLIFNPGGTGYFIALASIPIIGLGGLIAILTD